MRAVGHLFQLRSTPARNKASRTVWTRRLNMAKASWMFLLPSLPLSPHRHRQVSSPTAPSTTWPKDRLVSLLQHFNVRRESRGMKNRTESRTTKPWGGREVVMTARDPILKRDVRMKTGLKRASFLSFSRMEASWSWLTLPKVSRFSAPALPMIRMELMPERMVKGVTFPSATCHIIITRKSWRAASFWLSRAVILTTSRFISGLWRKTARIFTPTMEMAVRRAE